MIVLPMCLKECTFASCVLFNNNVFLTVVFRNARTFVFLQFIVRPNEETASANQSMLSSNASSESAIGAQLLTY